MAEINDGGPAFPSGSAPGQAEGVFWPLEAGMSLRDWFAGQALNGLLHPGWDANAANDLQLPARIAYDIADAMLAARGGSNG